jgi:translation initiation factor 1 (eIF-1/SUI1)
MEMIRRRAAIGLSLVLALVLCAVAAPNATALKGTTGFTCVKTTKDAQFSDEHCTKAKGGGEGWKHEEIALGTKTALSVSTTETGSKTIPVKFEGQFEEEPISIEAGEANSCAGGTTLKNSETVPMKAFGEICVDFTSLTVKEPANCVVKSGKIRVQGEWDSKTEFDKDFNTIMYLELKQKIPPPDFAEFTLVNKEGKACSLNEKAIHVQGTVRANVTMSNTSEGPTLQITEKEAQKNLHIEGNPVNLSATLTVRMEPVVGQESNPVVMTTTDK